MKSRRKRTAIAVAIFGGSVLAATAFLLRNDFLEMWHLSRLEAHEPAVRSRAMTGLRSVATMRSAPALVGVLRNDAGLRKEAVEVLLGVVERLSPVEREELGAMVLDTALSGIVEADPILRALGPGCPGMYPRLSESLDVPGSRLSNLATEVLLHSWPRSRKAIFDFAQRSEDHALLGFLENASWFGWFSEEPRPAPHILELYMDLMTDHPKPAARAMGLGFAVSIPRKDRTRGDLGLLHRAHDADPSPLVRSAALRMAGYLGDVDGNLDPGPLITRERDPVLRAEAIQARDLWSRDFSAREPHKTGLELWDGIRCPTLVRGTPRPKPWKADEIALLEEILASERNPALRDAASLALASHRATIEPTAAAPGLEVHEWGVWRDAREVLAPAGALADLPEFVHRSRITAKELWESRTARPRVDAYMTFKPVIFFHSREPLTALVRVEFLGGRPWAFYPEATDYLFLTNTESLDLDHLRPPWIPAPGTTGMTGSIDSVSFPPRGHELRSRFLVAPWFKLAPSREQVDFNEPSMGIEWRGLRLGYGPELEGDFASVDETSFWNNLRTVPSTPVAIRGSRERFLFYDGPIGIRSPVHACWEDESREVLLLAARPVDAYPEPRPRPTDRSPPSARMPDPARDDLAPRGSIPAVFVVFKPAGAPAMGGMLEELHTDRPPSRVVLKELPMDAEQIQEAFLSAFVAEGLTREEAVSLASTWKREFFEAEGVRTLTVLPRWLYDLALPLTVIPSPGKIARTGIVWKEMSDADAIAAPRDDEESALFWRPSPRSTGEVAIDVREEALPSLPWKPFTWAPGGLLDDDSSRAHALDLSHDGKRALIHAEPRSGKLDGSVSGCCPYVLDVARGRFLQLVVLAAATTDSVSLPDLSGDGDKLAFASVDGARWLLRIADLSKETLATVRLDVGEMVSSLEASLDGRRIVLSIGDSLVIVDMEGPRAWRMWFGWLGSRVLSFGISGDGRRAVCLLERDGGTNDDVYAVDLDARTTLDVSRSAGADRAPSISDDGRRIAFIRNVRGALELCVADLETRSRTCFGDTKLAHYDSCSIAPAGNRLAFTSQGRVYVSDLDSGTLRDVPDSLGAFDPMLSSEGSRVLYSRSESTGQRAYLVPVPP